MKAGYKTTEFWVTIGSFVISMLIMLGVLTNEQAEIWQEVIVLLVSAVFATFPAQAYVRGRSQVKVAHGRQ